MQKHATFKLSNGWIVHRSWESNSDEDDPDFTALFRHPEDLTQLAEETPLFGTEVAVFIPRVTIVKADIGLGASSELL